MSTTDQLNDADIKAAEPAMIVKLAAALSAVTGVLIFLCGLQLVGARFYEEWLNLVKYALMVGGVAQLGLATQLYRARMWAVLAGTGLDVLIALVIGAWGVYSFSNAMISCLVFISVPLSILAAIMAVISIGPARHTVAARERLANQGLDLGL